MRLRNTMLHSGNLKAVLTTNLQPPIPPPYVWSPLSLISSPPSLLSTNTRSFDTYHPLDCRPHYPAVVLAPVVTFSFFCLYSFSPFFLSIRTFLRHSFLGLPLWVTIFKFTSINPRSWQRKREKPWVYKKIGEKFSFCHVCRLCSESFLIRAMFNLNLYTHTHVYILILLLLLNNIRYMGTRATRGGKRDPKKERRIEVGGHTSLLQSLLAFLFSRTLPFLCSTKAILFRPPLSHDGCKLKCFSFRECYTIDSAGNQTRRTHLIHVVKVRRHAIFRNIFRCSFFCHSALLSALLFAIS